MGETGLRISVLYVDSAILVVNKPAGVTVLIDGYNPQAPYIKQILSEDYGRLWVVHRLDRDTSGVLVLARSSAAHRRLNGQFENRQVRKIYHGLVVGNPIWDVKMVEYPLMTDADRHHRTVVNPKDGKEAVTNLEVIERFKRFCLVEAIPLTGRTHQIRVHLSAVGFPIVMDKLYGGGKSVDLTEFEGDHLKTGDRRNHLLNRIGLHSLSIALKHPEPALFNEKHAENGIPKEICFKADYPEDFQFTLSILRRNK